jgi:hypothetical protein
MIDDLIFQMRVSSTNTVKAFYNLLFEKTSPSRWADDYAGPIPFTEIKYLYEQYCFLKNYPESNIARTKNEKYLKNRSYKIWKVADSFTEVFEKLKFNSEGRVLKSVEISSEMSSLEIFFKTQCELTQFSEDYIPYVQFKER